MAVTVKLKNIIEGLEFQSDKGSSYLNTTTGEVVYTTDYELRAAEDETPRDHLPQLRRAQHQSGVAAEKCAEAAVIEEQLRDRCFTQGLKDKAFVHGFSAASCWAQAGDFHHAIVLCQELLAHADLPERLRHRVDAYAETLHARRAQWYEELILQDVGHEE
jgi:hypothetical protein